MDKKKMGFLLAILIGMAAAGPVMAADSTGADDSLLGVAAVSDDALGKANGRENFTLNNADLDSVHAFNEANGAHTGSASIGAGALSDFHGNSVAVVNSGNNAVVQVSQQVIFNLY